ncbi:MAG: hypothetical protein JNK92_10220 [Dechloromonas sp.]|nr:hypothetical protein [Dechloromonas sp.]
MRNAMGWRLRRVFGDHAVDAAMISCARRWRPLLKKPQFIGVTGSAGKTTTKELLLGMLSHKGQAVGNDGSYSNIDKQAEALLRLAPSHSFFVTELSGHRSGEMDENLPLVQPSIGIVTVVRDDHSSKEYTREAIADEKGKLIAALPATGTAVLNADDELVLAMAAKSVARVITYGLSPNAELRAEAISSVWPERLQMTLVRGSERVRLLTQLCGTHWVPSVLGAIGGGLAAGMTLDECAQGIASVAPFDGRMQPVTTPDGVTFIRDEWKGTLWTVEASFAFMQSAQAKRKIIVIGTLADCGSGAPQKLAQIAKWAQQISDHTIFVGHWASNVLKARKPGEDKLRAFSRVRDATQYVNSISREGDLILLKGTSKQDHLLRIILARNGAVACWRDDCNRSLFCNECHDLNKPSGAPLLLGSLTGQDATSQAETPGPLISEFDQQVIVGLGNPEAKYSNTPHNLGYEVADQLASSLKLTWDTTPEAWVARGSAKGRAVCLIKIRMPMNATGAGLKQLSEGMAFDPAKCVLVYDDFDLTLGTVKTRLNGGAGGHRGVASILEAFQSDSFRRVKVGVKKAGEKLDPINYVLTAFDAESRIAIDKSIQIAMTRVLELVETQPRRK